MSYYQLSLDRKFSKMWKRDKICKKLKRKMCPSKSIEIIFTRIFERMRRIKTMEQNYANIKITQILDEVIGDDYFGNTQNRKRFYHLVNKITTHSRCECVYLSALSRGYNIIVIPWLQAGNLDERKTHKLLQKANLYLLNLVVKPLVKHFYHALKCFRGYEVKFIKRSKWHSFQQEIFNELLLSKFLTLTSDVNTNKSRGKLRLFPKVNCDCLEYRPLISPIKYTLNEKLQFKCISRKIDQVARELSDTGNISLFTLWKKFCEKTIGKEIYGIKLDVRDAFGNASIEKLCEIIKKSKFSFKDKQFITDHIKYQYISYEKKLYRWNHGLLQGDRLSSCLCNLYLSNSEREQLQTFRQGDYFLHRIVDDYFFCSTQKSDIEMFEYTIKSMLQINETKTQKVVNDKACLITYFGQIFNLENRQVNKLYSFKKTSPIRHKFKFWNIKKPIPEESKWRIISRTLMFPYNNHCFKRIELNTFFNTEETVLLNYFHGMVFIAFKFEAAVMAVRNYRQKAIEMMPYLINILEEVVYNYSTILFSKIKRCGGVYYRGNITFKMLKNIAYRAFILVFRKSYSFYKDFITYIVDQNNLYLNLEDLDIVPAIFTKLPKPFADICLSRRSYI